MKRLGKKSLILAIALMLGIGATMLTAFGQSQTPLENALTEGNLTEAMQSATRSINSNRNNAMAYAVRGLLLFILKDDTTNALADLKQAAQLEPNNGVILAFLANVEPNREMRKQLAEKALKRLDSPRTGLEHYAKAGALLLYGRSGEMLDDLNSAIELNPNFSLAYNRRGTYYRDKKQYDSAIKDFGKAIDISPDYGYAYSNRADIYLEKKSYDAAIKDYTKALAVFPNDAGFYLNRGACYYNSDKPNKGYEDYTKAIELYSRNIEKDPKDSYSFSNRGVTYSNLRDYARATADYSAAIQLNPQDSFNYFKRAEAHEKLGKMDLGKADRRKYTELGGNEPTPDNIGENLYPEANFDFQAAKNMLARGNSTIRGVACTGGASGTYKSANVTVSLFPVTPYFDQWYKLREKKEDKKTGVFMSSEANRWRIDVKTDGEGRFAFTDLKPGRYFLQSFDDYSTNHSQNVFVGSDEDTDYYEKQRYSLNHSFRLEKFIDIKTDGEEVKTALKKGEKRLMWVRCGD